MTRIASWYPQRYINTTGIDICLSPIRSLWLLMFAKCRAYIIRAARVCNLLSRDTCTLQIACSASHCFLKLLTSFRPTFVSFCFSFSFSVDSNAQFSRPRSFCIRSAYAGRFANVSFIDSVAIFPHFGGFDFNRTRSFHALISSKPVLQS